jgi:hypothetical protein
MKRYLLFRGLDHYPHGGMQDFVKDFDSIDEARNHLKQFKINQYKNCYTYEDQPNDSNWLSIDFWDTEWAHIYDIEHRKTAWQLIEHITK